MKTYCLIYHDHDEDGPCALKVLGVSHERSVLVTKRLALCRPYRDEENSSRNHERRMKARMRAYLMDNLMAIDGFRHEGVKNEKDRDHILEFLVNNWSWSIRDFAGDNTFIRAYCDVSKLKQPFPIIEPTRAMLLKPRWYYHPDSLSICKGPRIEDDL